MSRKSRGGCRKTTLVNVAARTVAPPRRRLGPLSGVARRGKIDYFLAALPKDARILDVGCADGWFGRAAAQRGYHNVIGVDIEAPADLVGDIRQWRELGLEAHSFDAIVAFEVIEHGDFEATFWQLLRPGGLLCLTTPLPQMDGVCEALERMHLLQQRGSAHTHLTDLRELRHFGVVTHAVKAGVSQWGLLRALPVDAIPDQAPRVRRARLTQWLVDRRRRRAAAVPADIYDTDYFLSNACEGLSEYLSGELSILRRREVELLDLEAGHRVLDLGCGRGETSAEMARRLGLVVSIDYSWDATVLAAKQMQREDVSRVAQADAVRLPFADGSFDRVLLGDVIEHLPWALAASALKEVERVLAPGGRAVIHTSPNTWFIAVVKPAVVLAMRLMGRTEVVARFAEYDRLRGPMHPNELSPRTLPKLLRTAGVNGRSWVDPDVLRSGSSEWTEKLADSRFTSVVAKVAGAMPFRLVLGNDLYAVVEAPAGRRSHSATRAAAASITENGSTLAR
jgi:2-polyprenyl-3-methyl-5-hydroxy-6-metoxy-1,4-benzoquinol methylase